jgi:hypothetical protein|tara:strand:- start:611 stop:1090 length:480 start_codon:yes stop_codon:yes gene_type:complete
MYLTIPTNNFEINNVIISDKSKNNIIENSYFYRMYYSTDLFSTNGIYIRFNLYDLDIEEYYNKIKCNFSRYDENNKMVIKQLVNIEHQILKNYAQLTQNPVYTIREQLVNYYIKLFHKENKIIGKVSRLQIILKVSGLWLTNKEHGLTFRFIIVDTKRN